ncbi:cholecystokinin receptor-like [Apostichopus japonicus]|uniref:cholecystokinin receptor-like n=1 Tax=Stichopus japonicus TaxID=307972 RepID=UPI003AB46E08
MEVGGCDGDGYNASSSYSYSYSEVYSGSHFEGSSLKVGQTIVQVILIISLAIISIVGVVGNFLVILSLSIDSRKLGITSILLGSLAITDFFVTAWYVPMEIKFIISPVWRFGAVLCMFNGFLGVFVQSSSACMLLVISCERFLVILYPLASRTILTRRRTFILVGACWVVAAGLATFPASYKRVVIFFCDPMCTNAYHDKPAVRVFFYFYALVLLYLLPLGGMAISNTCVIRALIRSSRYTKKLQSMKSLEKGVKYSTTSRSNGEATITDKPIYRNKNGADVTTDGKSTVDSMVTSGSDEDPFPPVAKAKKSKVKSRHSSVAQRQKVVVMLVSVILLYAVCWLPYFIFGMLHVLVGVNYGFGMIIFEAFAKILYSCNSALNPIVYGFMSKNFRQRIIHALSRLNFWSRRKGRSNSFGSAYTLSTRGSGVSQTARQTRYSVLPRA